MQSPAANTPGADVRSCSSTATPLSSATPEPSSQPTSGRTPTAVTISSAASQPPPLSARPPGSTDSTGWPGRSSTPAAAYHGAVSAPISAPTAAVSGAAAPPGTVPRQPPAAAAPAMGRGPAGPPPTPTPRSGQDGPAGLAGFTALSGAIGSPRSVGAPSPAADDRRGAVRAASRGDERLHFLPMDTTLSRPDAGHLLDGRYRVGSWIARGGMATVYMGIDTKLDRTVALKIAHAELAGDQEFVRRFTGEARSVAPLSSPNVVAVYDQGSDGDLLYLVMEYVPGRTLRELLRERGRLGPREALDISSGVLTGLAAPHQAGIVHRDVKPENVLLGEGDTVKVADFGLARAASGVSHTRTGMLIGTAAYLAPEQVSRSSSDARTDVYAAGIMLFEMLTGAQPHTGDSPLAVPQKHVSDVVPAPSSLVPSLPPSLDALVALATSRDPELRPADAGQFLHAITDVRRGMPIGSPQPEPLAHQAQHLPPGGPVPGTSALAGPDAVSFAVAPATDFAGTPASDFAGAGASDFPGEAARAGAPANDFRSAPASDLLGAPASDFPGAPASEPRAPAPSGFPFFDNSGRGPAGYGPSPDGSGETNHTLIVPGGGLSYDGLPYGGVPYGEGEGPAYPGRRAGRDPPPGGAPLPRGRPLLPPCPIRRPTEHDYLALPRALPFG